MNTHPPGHKVGRVRLNEQFVERDEASHILEREGPTTPMGEQGCESNVGVGKLMQPGLGFLPSAREAVPVDLVVPGDVLKTQQDNIVLSWGWGEGGADCNEKNWESVLL